MHDLTYDDGHLAFDVDNASVTSVLRELTELDIANLTITPPSLEELFMRHYGDTPTDVPEGEQVATR